MNLREVYKGDEQEGSDGRSRQKQAVLALLIFTVLATALLHRSLLPGYTLLPLDLIQTLAPWDKLSLGPLENPLISDPFYSFYPRRHFLTEAIQSGQFPLWNPYIMSGTPTIANPNFQPFYPPNLIAAVFLPAHHALPWLAWGHLILTGWLMYGFLRRHRLHWLACTAGASVWMLNGYIVVWLENPHRLSTLAWLPGIFWAYQASVDERRYDYAVVGGLLLGISILGGQMQFIFASGLILGIYAFSQMLWDGFKHRRWSLSWLGLLFTIGLFGLGVGALILLPASEFAAFSQRYRFTAETIANTGWPWQHLVTLVAPDFYGNPVNEVGYWGPFNYAEMTAYFGVAALLLSLTALFVARQRKFLFSAGIMTLFVTAVIFGTPIVQLFFFFPGAEFVVLTRLLFLVPLCGAWLAALGFDGWLAAPAQRRWSLAIALAALGALILIVLWIQSITPGIWPQTYADLGRSVLILFLTSGSILLLVHRPRLAAYGLLLIVALDLLTWGWDFNPITSIDYLYPQSEIADFLQQDTSLHRVLPLHSEKVIFGPNVLAIFGIQTPSGYTPLIQERYRDFLKGISDKVEFSWLASPNKLVMSRFDPAVSLLNVKYILSARPLPVEAPLQIEQMVCDTAMPLSASWQTEAFTVTEPGLNRVDVLFAANNADKAVPVTFHLWRDEMDGELIAAQEIMLAPGTEPTVATVYFAPVADAVGQVFIWGVRSEETTAVCATIESKPAFAAYSTQLLSHGAMDGVWIYENPNHVPRAYLVHHVVTEDEVVPLSYLRSSGVNYFRTAVVAGSPSATQRQQLMPKPVRTNSIVEITSYGLQRVDLSVALDIPGILVLTDSYYPGWEVTVNETKQEVLRVNEVYRGVFLSAGTHLVTFQFRPRTLYWGMAISTLTILVAVVTLIIFYKKPKIEVN